MGARSITPRDAEAAAARELPRRVLHLLLGLDAAALLLHAAAGVTLLPTRGGWSPGGWSPPGSADAGPLGLMAPAQLALLALLLALRARRTGCPWLPGAALAAGLLALGDLAELPARLGAALAPWTGACWGLGRAQAAKLAAGAGFATFLATLVVPLLDAGTPEARRAGRALGGVLLGLVLVDLALDLPAGALDHRGVAAAVLDAAEELGEAVVATLGLVAVLAPAPSAPRTKSHNKTIAARPRFGQRHLKGIFA